MQFQQEEARSWGEDRVSSFRASDWPCDVRMAVAYICRVAMMPPRYVGALGLAVLLALSISHDTGRAQDIPNIRDMTSDQLLSLVAQLRRVSDLRNHAQVARLLPFELEKIEPVGHWAGANAILIPAAQITDWPFHFDYVIGIPGRGVSDDYGLYVNFHFGLGPEPRLCISRQAIMGAFGPDDPRPHPGYPTDLPDEAMDRLLRLVPRDHVRPEQPYVMTYATSPEALQPLEFAFKTGHCLTDVTIGTNAAPHLSMPVGAR